MTQINNQDISQSIYPMRLQKFLARAGVASRRGSEDLMTAGRVSVNDTIVTELGSKVDPTCDLVKVDGIEVHLESGPVYIMLNKPAGYLTTMKDPYNRPCVASLVPTEKYPGLFPVGRLDMDTTGLLLFTTNGEAGQKLLHPSFEKDKRYIALLNGVLSKEDIALLESGIELEDGPCAPAKVEQIASARYAITIHEGRKHQVKRMFAACGFAVLALHRDTFGPLKLGNLTEGSWRLLTQDEQHALEAAISSEEA